MKIFKDSIFDMSREGRFTFQIPDLIIGESNIEYEEVPDEYLMIFNRKGKKPGREAFGKEEGFLYLSEEGFEVHKDQLMDWYFDWCFRNGFRDDGIRGKSPRTRAEYLERAREFYRKVKENTERERQARLAKGMKV